MEFGDRKSFAVQFELDADYGGEWLYGRFCYWINGIQVGDYELGTSLRDVFFQMKWIVSDSGNREGGTLCKGSSEKVFLVLDRSLYGTDDYQSDKDIQLPSTPARFDIRIPIDVFDQWKIYLVECNNKALVLYKTIDDIKLEAFTLPVGEFERVIKEAYDNLEELYNNKTATSPLL